MHGGSEQAIVVLLSVQTTIQLVLPLKDFTLLTFGLYSVCLVAVIIGKNVNHFLRVSDIFTDNLILLK